MKEKEVQPEGNYFNKYETKNFIMNKLMAGFFKQIKVNLDPLSYENVIDIGCGEGYGTNFIFGLRPTAITEGMDMSERLMKECSQKYPKITFEVGSILDIKREDNSYDLVTACEVLEHIDDPDTALKELFRISRKYVMITVPNEPIWRVCNMLRGKYVKNFGNTPGHVQHWSKSAIAHLISKYGKVLKTASPFPWTLILCEKVEKK